MIKTSMLQPNTQANQMWNWQGISGYWYIHTIYPIYDIPPFSNVNYIFVKRLFDGRRIPLYIGQTKDYYNRAHTHEKLTPSIRMGANEVHIHLLAKGTHDRFRIETDLRRGHYAPLNMQ